jgi:hypothetical protein
MIYGHVGERTRGSSPEINLVLWAPEHAAHRCSLSFGVAIYYDVERDLASVWRVLDCRRDPVWTRQQFKRR